MYKTGADDENGDGDRPDNPVANVLRNGQRNVTDVGTLVELMRGAELSLIGRSDLLGVKTFRRLSNRSFVEQLVAANGGRRADAPTPTRRPRADRDDRRTTVVVNKLPPAASAAAANDDDDGKSAAYKTFTGIFDLKITSAYMNGFYAAAGPPFTVDRELVEPFRWSDSAIRNVAHHGQPDSWDYDLDGVAWVWD